MVAAAAQGARWQADVRRLMGMDGYVTWHAGLIVLLSAAVGAVLVLLSRALRLGTRTVARPLARVVPRPVAYGVGGVVAFLVLGFAQGFLFNGIVSAFNRASSVTNGTTTPGIRQPASAELSGSPESLVQWSTLGVKGRDFVATAPRWTSRRGLLRQGVTARRGAGQLSPGPSQGGLRRGAAVIVGGSQPAQGVSERPGGAQRLLIGCCV